MASFITRKEKVLEKTLEFTEFCIKYKKSNKIYKFSGPVLSFCKLDKNDKVDNSK